MKLAYEKTPRRQWESFHCEVVRGVSYNATWHFHPEYQLTLVLKSKGHRLIGDNLTPLRAGDLVLVGANLPHVWRQETSSETGSEKVHAVIIRFLDTCLGQDFLKIPEARSVFRLLKRAERGLNVTGRTREVVAEKIKGLPNQAGLERIAGLLSILETLAQSDELRPISSPGFVPHLTGEDQDRIGRVIDFIHSHVDEPINRSAVAAQAALSVCAFSRFFKLRTGKTLPEYVNELRVGRACQLLADERAKVIDIALQCGFHNLANFNRRFHALTHMTPSQYRRRLLWNAT
jgi:AraC-like DNA-binding protein